MSIRKRRLARQEFRAAIARANAPKKISAENIIRKVQRIRRELGEICDGIDKFLEARANARPAKDLFS